MKFMLMMHTTYGTGEWEHANWSPEAWDAHMDYWHRLNADLKASGEMVEVQALSNPGKAKIVRAGNEGVPAITDGPFAESKEFLAGYWLVDVDSPERAYQIAARASAVPGPDGAPLHMPLEVRQVMSAPATD